MTNEDEPVIAEDNVPTNDQYADTPPPVTYRDWDPEATRVVTYFIGGDGSQFDPRKPIKWAATRELARAAVVDRHGRIYEENHLPGRSYFRVGLAPTSLISAGSSGEDSR